MSAQDPQGEYAGWFGKLPSLGDFVTRNLPRSFVEPWDHWLSTELSDARLAVPDTWEGIYERAPPVCFSLAAGVLDDYSWHGILVASFDRVGRRFPLTIALCLGQHAAAVRTREWWATLVAIGRRAVEHGGGTNMLDEALTGFVSREPAFVPHHDWGAPVVDPAFGIPAGSSAWWPWRAERHVGHCMFGGLPRGESFRALLRSL